MFSCLCCLFKNSRDNHPVLFVRNVPEIIELQRDLSRFTRIAYSCLDLRKMILKFFDRLTIPDIQVRLNNNQVNYQETCRKPIAVGEAYYHCVDCDKIRNMASTYTSLLFQECFLKSEHEGHRIIIFNAQSANAICDCGDPASMDPQGFCQKHMIKEIKF